MIIIITPVVHGSSGPPLFIVVKKGLKYYRLSIIQQTGGSKRFCF